MKELYTPKPLAPEFTYEQASVACDELAESFNQLAESYLNPQVGVDERHQALAILERGCGDFFAHTIQRTFREPLIAALERLIPVTCLPSEYGSHVELADHLTVALSGSVVLMAKEQSDLRDAATIKAIDGRAALKVV